MKSYWIKKAIAAAALMCVGAANAYVITFENVDNSNAPFYPLMADGDYLTQGNYFANTQDAFAGGGLIGQLSTGSENSSCLDGACPTGNSTNFLSVFDDGLLHVGNLDGSKVKFASTDVAFLKASGDAVGTVGMYMAVEADRADGSYAVWAVPVSGVGSFTTLTATAAGGLVGGQFLGGTGSLFSGNVTDLFFYAYYCNPTTGSCSAFKTNKGQFAIDNITLDVPEPSGLILAAVALGALGVSRRRRSV